MESIDFVNSYDSFMQFVASAPVLYKALLTYIGAQEKSLFTIRSIFRRGETLQKLLAERVAQNNE